jgi:uncharacterized membrane protein YeaQ/YmgE (transglycosylase-associated protein family)
VLAAVLTEIVLIGALANQWVAERAGRWILNERSGFVADLKAMLLVYNWRFAPQHGDTEHAWLGQLVMVVATVVLTAGFVAVVVKGPATFGRVFLTCALTAVGATVLAAYFRALVTDEPLIPGSRIQKALFGPLSPNAINVLASVLLGIFSGLVAAFVATRFGARQPAEKPAAATGAAEPAYVPPEQPPPFFPPRPRPTPDQQTTRFPRLPDEDELGYHE